MCCDLLKAKEYWIWLLSFFYFVVAIILISFGVISLQTTGELLSEVDLLSPSMAATVTGGLLLGVSMLGAFAGYRVYKNAKGPPVMYPSLVFVVISMLLNIVMLAAGIAMLRYRRFFEQVSENNFAEIGEKILVFELAVFEDCCSPDAADPEFCDDNGFLFPCISDTELYGNFLDYIGDATCSYFEDGGVTSRTDPEGCAGQQILPFIPAISGYLYGQLTILGALNISLALVLLLITSSIAFTLRDLEGYESTRKASFELAAHPKDLGVEKTTNFDYDEEST